MLNAQEWNALSLRIENAEQRQLSQVCAVRVQRYIQTWSFHFFSTRFHHSSNGGWLLLQREILSVADETDSVCLRGRRLRWDNMCGAKRSREIAWKNEEWKNSLSSAHRLTMPTGFFQWNEVNDSRRLICILHTTTDPMAPLSIEDEFNLAISVFFFFNFLSHDHELHWIARESDLDDSLIRPV